MAQVSTVSRVSNASGVTSAQSTRGAQVADAGSADATSVPSAAALAANAQASEKVLPLPGWLTKVYFIFPVVLYIPDALFNYFVYSDGIATKSTNPVLQAGFVVLWSFLSVGVVGMAYLLSVLAPWHWGQGHRIQAIFCGFGVVVATGITTWNSLAYRSQNFIQFRTDNWAYAIWPQLHTNGISVTMILVSIAPPFWGLFWAIVQPTQTGRSLRQLQESHEERLMRLQQEAELKRLRAQTNATIREAQVRGMAQTAAAVREQASGVLASHRPQRAASLPPQYSESAAEIGQTAAPREVTVLAQPTALDLAPDEDHVGDGKHGDESVDAHSPQGLTEEARVQRSESLHAIDENGDDHASEHDHGLSYPLHTRSTTTPTTSGKHRRGSAQGVERTTLASYGIPKS